MASKTRSSPPTDSTRAVIGDVVKAVAHLRGSDKRLAPFLRRIGPCQLELKHASSVFAALAEAIVHQQLSDKAAATIFGRVCALAPNGLQGLHEENLQVIDDAALRGAGLSRNKLLALRDLAARSLQGEVPTFDAMRDMTNEEVIVALTAVRGIGRWTAEMLLIFHLGRADVMAIDDLGLRQGHAIVVGEIGTTDRKALAAYAERWQPYRSVASWYLWRIVELTRQQARPSK